jgi:hypothetical protein
MRNRLSVEKMNKLCFIYINSRSIRAALKQTDTDAVLLKEIMVDLLLNQEDDLVRNADVKQDDDEEEYWEDIQDFMG